MNNKIAIQGGIIMSYFADDSIEEEILADCQYMQRQKNVSDIQIIKSLLEVVTFFTNNLEEQE